MNKKAYIPFLLNIFKEKTKQQIENYIFGECGIIYHRGYYGVSFKMT